MSLTAEALLAVIGALLLCPISTGSHHGSPQRHLHLQKRLEDVFRRFLPLVTSHATLNHGADCVSPYEEKLRLQIVEDLHVIATSHATLGHTKDTIKKMEEFISMNDKELCNYHLALVCDPESRKCVCGPSRVNLTYVFEDGSCRYGEGSMCSRSSKVECAEGTRCISITTLEECVSGLCFCQREFDLTSTTDFPKTTSGNVIIEVFGDGDDDEDEEEEEENEDNTIPIPPMEPERKEDKEEEDKLERLEPITSTKASFIPKSSAEGDDYDDGSGEEKVIVVKIDEVEKTVSSISGIESPLPEDGSLGRDLIATTTSTPVATSPVPTRRQELTSAIRRLGQEVESLKSLGFGDECFSINEESNYAEYRRLSSDMDCVTGVNDEENLTEILTKLEMILESGSKMCNWTLHLQCNGQSKKCECRTSASEVLGGFYLLFMEENKKCVLVSNSRCLSREHLTSRNSPFTDIPCTSEAKCIADETKAECKSKIENCFCRKPAPVKPTEPPKQKKSRSRGGGKTSAANSFSCAVHYVILFGLMISLTMLLPQMVLIG